jgi:hypothetical protein
MWGILGTVFTVHLSHPLLHADASFAVDSNGSALRPLIGPTQGMYARRTWYMIRYL